MNTQLMPFDKALELCTIAFSSKSSTPDIVYANDMLLLELKKWMICCCADLWANINVLSLYDFTPTVQKERAWQDISVG